MVGRRQAVIIKEGNSDYANVSAGVPQCSVLGPLFFLIYISDIVKDIESVIKLFADDKSMCLCLDNDEVHAEILNSDSENTSTGATKWKVTFYNTKTELKNVPRKKDLRPLPIKFEDTAREQHKHLGVILQKYCEWDEHIKSIIVKGRILVACLRSDEYRLSRKSLENVYKSVILPHFGYAGVIYDNISLLLLINSSLTQTA